MKYNFDEIVDRHGSNSVKWDYWKDCELIPMWVADMDFKAAPFIIDAVQKRVSHGVFGYTWVPERYYQSVIDWFAKRRGWKIEREWIKYVSGIVPALSIAVDALTEPGDKVIFNTPAYNCFFSSVRNLGREMLTSPLKYENGTYAMDFEDMERKCQDPQAKLFILCNPQNPAGRVWTREELTRVGEICLRNGVTVVTDEIHCELEMPGHTFTPFASICSEFQQNCVAFNSPSKSFNIAGLEIANIITCDKDKRDKIDKTINAFEHCDVNPLGVEALMAAYTPEGEEWLRQLNSYLSDNYKMLVEMVAEQMPMLKVVPLEGTYLAWLDCKALTTKGIDTEAAQKELMEVDKVWINSGKMYGDADFMRINIACPHSTFKEGMTRVLAGLKRLYSSK